MNKKIRRITSSLLVVSLVFPISMGANTAITRTPRHIQYAKPHTIKPALESIQTAYEINQAKKKLAERIRRAPAGSLAAGTYTASNFNTLQQASAQGVVNTMPPVNGEGIPDEIMIAIKAEMTKLLEAEMKKATAPSNQIKSAEIDGTFSFSTDTKINGQETKLNTDVDYTIQYDVKDLEDIKFELESTIKLDVDFKDTSAQTTLAEMFNLDKGRFDLNFKFVGNEFYFQIDNISDSIKNQINSQNQKDGFEEIDWSIFEGKWINMQTNKAGTNADITSSFTELSQAMNELQQTDTFKAQLLESQAETIKEIDTLLQQADKLFEKYPVISFDSQGNGKYFFRLDEKYLVPFGIELMNDMGETVTESDLAPLEDIKKYVRTMSGDITVTSTSIEDFSLDTDIFVPEDATLPEVKTTIKLGFNQHKTKSSYSLDLKAHAKMSGSELGRLEVKTAGKRTSSSYEDKGHLVLNFDDDFFGSSSNSLDYSFRVGKFDRKMRIYRPSRPTNIEDLVKEAENMNLFGMGIAKKKSQENKIKSNLDTIRTQSQMFYSDNNFSYGNHPSYKSCSSPVSGSLFADRTVQLAIQNASGVTANTTTKCSAKDNEYAISVSLDKNKFWCVDSTGAAKEISKHITTSHCPNK